MNASLIIFIGIVQGILFFAHFITYKAVLFFGNIEGKAIIFTRLSFLALSIFFMLGSLITARGYSFAGKSIYTLASIWLGILFWLFAVTIIGSLIWYLTSLIAPSFSGNIHARQSFGLILLAFVFIINLYGLINALSVSTTKYSVSLPNLPQEWKNKKAVFLADTHYGNIWNKNSAENLVEKIERMDPDIIFISGDFYDGPIVNFKEIAEVYKPLVESTQYGIYFVTGNHEEYQDKNMYLDPLREVGFKILENESVLIDGLRVSGVNNSDSVDSTKYEDVMKKIRSQIIVDKNEAYASIEDPTLAESKSNSVEFAPTILLKHIPLKLDIPAKFDVDLQLSGHTHHGQMWPFTYITKKIYSGFDYGLKTYTNSSSSMQVITTSGAGSWGPPQRIGTKNEIVEITLN